MRKLDFRAAMLLILTVFGMSSAFASRSMSPAVDSISITIYADLRDTTDLQSYDNSIMYITGHWTPPTSPGAGDWTFIVMDSIAPNIFKATFKYAPGQFAGNTGDDPDLLPDHPGWYFAPTNDWSTSEHVPAPCNVAWDIQRIFEINVTKADTVVAFKYGVCGPESLCDLDIPEICVTSVQSGITENGNIFPNPAIEFVTLKSSARINNVKIVDITGKTVQQLKVNGVSEVTFSVKNLHAQLYFVQYESANGKVSTSKLLKK